MDEANNNISMDKVVFDIKINEENRKIREENFYRFLNRTSPAYEKKNALIWAVFFTCFLSLILVINILQDRLQGNVRGAVIWVGICIGIWIGFFRHVKREKNEKEKLKLAQDNGAGYIFTFYDNEIEVVHFLGNNSDVHDSKKYLKCTINNQLINTVEEYKNYFVIVIEPLGQFTQTLTLYKSEIIEGNEDIFRNIIFKSGRIIKYPELEKKKKGFFDI